MIADYIYDEELSLWEKPFSIIKNMVSNEEIEVIGINSLNFPQKCSYESVFALLAAELELDLNNTRGASRGEAETLAIAHALRADYFISVNRDAGIAATKSGIEVNIWNYGDIINHIKEHSNELSINRRTARQMFLYQSNEKHDVGQSIRVKLSVFRERLKKDFDSRWPVN